MLGQKITPLRRVGVYVPGGKAVYPSSVLMNIVPAKVAGVEEIVMTTPPGKDGKVNPTTLVAAKEAGADVIYKVGGAQAIAALAYGTESVSYTHLDVYKRQVHGALPDVLPPRLYAKGCGTSGGVSAGHSLHARAGAGFLSNPRHHFHLYVLYRAGSTDDGTCLCPKGSP